MKILVFAFKPPPHHGQSYMVQLLLDALGGDVRHSPQANSPSQLPSSPNPAKAPLISCYHVDSRVSESNEDTGRFRVGKIFRMLKYGLEAIWCRFRYGVKIFYCVPAPGVRSAIYRDWIVMALCRPFFRTLVFHWHGVGLGEWLEQQGSPLERWMTRALLRGADLSIVLGNYYRADVAKLAPKRIEEASNGIPDPCPDYDKIVLPRRQTRRSARLKLLGGHPLSQAELEQAGGAPQIFRICYLSLCVREKGLFDAVEAVAMLNQKLARQNSPLRAHLTVAGKFQRKEEQAEFAERIAQPDLNGKVSDGAGRVIDYRGFVAGEDKSRLLRESDCFCFPTYYPIEGHPVCLLEAMAFGLPIITTRWRAVPDLFSPGYPGLVEPRSPEQVAAVMEQFMPEEYGQSFRKEFLAKFTDVQFGARMRQLLCSVTPAND